MFEKVSDRSMRETKTVEQVHNVDSLRRRRQWLDSKCKTILKQISDIDALLVEANNIGIVEEAKDEVSTNPIVTDSEPVDGGDITK